MVRIKLLDEFLVVFVDNFNRAVWVYTRLKEVAERKSRKWRQEKCRLQLLGSRQPEAHSQPSGSKLPFQLYPPLCSKK